jgi:quinol monooxygenase YgiN
MSAQDTTGNGITVTYKWTAKAGKLDELTSIYEQVLEAMKQNEPDAQAVHCYVSADDNALHIRDDFKDAAALGLHLSTTAPAHFPQLLSIATPGTFLFHGDVPDELKQPIAEMGLAAEFATHTFGFDR